jgi:cation:H+ antiporter
MTILLHLLYFILALAVLVKGSDHFVKAAAAIAEKFGISQFMIGLTLVAIGTSLPELASSVFAALADESALIIGNVIGSNIANVALIIGVAASIITIKTEEKMLIRDGFIMLFVSVFFYILLLTNLLSKYTGILFVILYFVYLLFIFETRKKTRDEYHFKAFIPYFFKFRYILTLHRHVMKGLKYKKKDRKKIFLKEAIFTEKIYKDLLIVFLSGLAIYFGAKFMVDEAIYFANYFNIPTTIVGVTLVAFGTSVPELSITISAARKGYGTIAIGNIIGSNIANILLVAGVSSIIIPLTISKITLLFTGPVMLLTSLMLLFFIESDWKIHRMKGISFLAIYIGFMIILFFTLNMNL